MNGRGFGVVGGATVKKTTLNKKTDSHSSVSGCRIFFFFNSASIKKIQTYKGGTSRDKLIFFIYCVIVVLSEVRSLCAEVTETIKGLKLFLPQFLIK